jgi:hypothetical protein
MHGEAARCGVLEGLGFRKSRSFGSQVWTWKMGSIFFAQELTNYMHYGKQPERVKT